MHLEPMAQLEERGGRYNYEKSPRMSHSSEPIIAPSHAQSHPSMIKGKINIPVASKARIAVARNIVAVRIA